MMINTTSQKPRDFDVAMQDPADGEEMKLDSISQIIDEEAKIEQLLPTPVIKMKKVKKLVG